MTELIEEDKEYEDKGNYGHLCNILPTIAIDEVLQRHPVLLEAQPQLPGNLLGLHPMLARCQQVHHGFFNFHAYFFQT